MQLDDAAHVLGNADFFSICNLEQRRMLAFASDRRALKKGAVLYKVGDIIDGAYVLVSGELIAQDSEGAAPVDITHPGAVLGELALIAKHPRRTIVTAKSDAQLLLVPRDAFARLMGEFPDLAIKAAEKVRADIGTYVASIGQASAKISKK